MNNRRGQSLNAIQIAATLGDANIFKFLFPLYRQFDSATYEGLVPENEIRYLTFLL